MNRCACASENSRNEVFPVRAVSEEAVDIESQRLASSLIPCSNWISTGKLDLEHAFAMDERTALVFERRHDLLRFAIDHIACRGIRVLPAYAERDPARLRTNLDRRRRHRRICRRVKHVKSIIDAVGHPELALIGREPDAVAWTLEFLCHVHLVPFDHNTIEDQSSLQIADLESHEPIHVREDLRCTSVDREWTDVVRE